MEDVDISSGDERGDLANVTVATARHAARAIEMLQGAEVRCTKLCCAAASAVQVCCALHCIAPLTQMSTSVWLGPTAQLMGRQLFLRPFRSEVDALKRRFPAAAAEAARALEDLAAQGPPWGPGPPPHLRGPPPHMRSGSLSPFRGRSPPPFRGRSPPPPIEERGRKRARSGGWSRSPGRRAARSVSPDAILAPVLVDHFLQRGGQREWMLTGREVQVAGLRDSRDDAVVWQQVMPLVAAAGGTGAEWLEVVEPSAGLPVCC